MRATREGEGGEEAWQLRGTRFPSFLRYWLALRQHLPLYPKCSRGAPDSLQAFLVQMQGHPRSLSHPLPPKSIGVPASGRMAVSAPQSQCVPWAQLRLLWHNSLSPLAQPGPGVSGRGFLLPVPAPGARGLAPPLTSPSQAERVCQGAPHSQGQDRIPGARI